MSFQPYQLLKRGGRFLGAARSWIQWHKHNGSDVTWGSRDELSPPMTVREVEDLAAEVASAHEEERFREYENALRLAQKALEGTKDLLGSDLKTHWSVLIALSRIKEVLAQTEDKLDQPDPTKKQEAVVKE